MGFFKKNANATKEKKSSGNLGVNIDENLAKIKDTFFYPKNSALKIRELQLPGQQKRAAVLFLEEAVDTKLLSSQVIEPLLSLEMRKEDTAEASTVMDEVMTATNGKEAESFEDLTQALLDGSAVILLDGDKKAVTSAIIGFANRSISEPKIEQALLGTKTAFIESISKNRSLIRKQLRSEKLISEELYVGNRSKLEVSLLYIQDVADEKLINTIKEKISKIDKDSILEISVLEEYLEERPYSLFPSTYVTERPDRTSAFLLEGHVVLLMENSPGALIAPATFWSQFHTVEDHYLRMPFGIFSRIVRLLSLLIALFLPALYLATVTFHPEMLPTDLMLAIASARETVPFPVFWEVLFMEVTFEILREAGIRIPAPLGPTIGIVGALILGQAAVDANLVSPILVIIVALTGLSSFAIPALNLNMAIRITRFVFLIIANFLGLFGLSIAGALLVAYLVAYRSFGVPFFSPLVPHFPSSKDFIARPPVWKEWLRPYSAQPVDKQRGPKPQEDGES